MTFITQPNHHTCGTTAIYNAMVALGCSPPAFNTIKLLCNNTKEGTWSKDLVKGIKALGLRFKRVKRLSKRSGVYILTTKTGHNEYHYVVYYKGRIINNYSPKHKRYIKLSKVKLKDRILSRYEIY